MIVFLLLATAVSWLRADAQPISAGPITAPTVAHIVFGMSARNGCSDIRSIYDILRSCLFTIAACIYRAVHPNIPNPNLSFWGRLRVTLKITIYALIAPELFILWALRQRFGANEVAKDVNIVMAEKVKKLKPEFKWTQTHGQFAQMGGFARKDNKEVIYGWQLSRLLRDGQIDVDDLQLTAKEVNDKSKGDILSKGIVAFQTTWFMFECIARLRQGLPLIELEVVTLAFATLNAITYGLWWYKPLNVLCPIYIHVRSRDVRRRPVEDVQEVQDDAATGDSEQEALVGEAPGEVQIGILKKGKAKALAVVQTVHKFFADMVETFKEDAEEGWWYLASMWLVIIPVKGTILLIGELFTAVVRPLTELAANHGTGVVEDILPISRDSLDYRTHVPTFYAEDLENEFFWIIPLTAFIGMIFGAIHFISWHSVFPTHAQLLLWRISCIVLVFQPFFLIFAEFIIFVGDALGIFNWLSKIGVDDILGIINVLTFSLGIIFYIVARFSVVVLAFLTLRDLPLGAFTEISWTSYIPHF